MIEPVRPSPALDFDYRLDSDGAETVIASIYYQDTLKPAEPKNLTADSASLQNGKKEIEKSLTTTEKSFFSKAKDWLWSLFSWGQKTPAAVASSEMRGIVGTADDGTPRLEAPNKQLAQTQELVWRLKDIAEFEEEMRQSSSTQLDKLIFLHLVSSSLLQKRLKEEMSIHAQQELMELYKKNKELQKTYYSVLDEINSRAKTNSILHWVNIGATAGIVGSVALAFATGGGSLVIALGLSLSSLGKGGTMLSEGILKYKNDLETGKLFVITQETKGNSSHIQEELQAMGASGNEISELLKMIREHLENQSNAERASFGRH